jgi:hypothetical protein
MEQRLLSDQRPLPVVKHSVGVEWYQTGPGHAVFYFANSGWGEAWICDLGHSHETKREAVECMRARAINEL